MQTWWVSPYFKKPRAQSPRQALQDPNYIQFDERGLPMNSTNDNAELRGQPSGESTKAINSSGSPAACLAQARCFVADQEIGHGGYGR